MGVIINPWKTMNFQSMCQGSCVVIFKYKLLRNLFVFVIKSVQNSDLSRLEFVIQIKSGDISRKTSKRSEN